MNETQLRALADEANRRAVTCRPLEQVIARGTSLRRRRRALRAAGLTSAATALATAAAVGIVTRDEGPPDVASGRRPAPEARASSDASARGSCSEEAEWVQLDPERIDPVFRVLPAWLPAGFRLTGAEATHQSSYRCATQGPALVLFATQGDSIEAALTVTAERPGDPALPPNTEVRGIPARMEAVSANGPGFTVEWREPDGSWWSVDGSRVDEATLRAFVEALILDGTPAPGSAGAGVPETAVPAGFQVVGQVIEPAEPEDDVTWEVTFSSGRDDCRLSLSKLPRQLDPRFGGPVEMISESQPQAVPTQVGGRAGVTTPGGDGNLYLYWDVRPDQVLGQAKCPVDAETLVRIAESLEPVEPDDPRLRELLR